MIQRLDCHLSPLLPHGDFASNHFGHFFVEEVPYIIASSLLDRKLYVNRPLLTPHRELLELASLQDLSSTVVPLTSQNSILTLKGPRAQCNLIQTSSQFFRLAPSSITNLYSKISEDFSPSRVCTSRNVAVVIRKSESISHSRWSNINSLVNYKDSFNYIPFQPESFGPVGVSDFLRANSVSIVVAAIGSACYQFFVDPACSYNILLILGDFNPKMPHQYYSTIYPFSSRYWILYHDSESSDWNASFHAPPSIVNQCLEFILHTKDFYPITLSGNWILHPPGSSFGGELRYGIRFH